MRRLLRSNEVLEDLILAKQRFNKSKFIERRFRLDMFTLVMSGEFRKQIDHFPKEIANEVERIMKPEAIRRARIILGPVKFADVWKREDFIIKDEEIPGYIVPSNRKGVGEPPVPQDSVPPPAL